jgi:hypothetical protein
MSAASQKPMQPVLLTASTLKRLRAGGYAEVQRQTVRHLRMWLAGGRAECDEVVRQRFAAMDHRKEPATCC